MTMLLLPKPALKKNDVLTEVNGKTVQSVKDIKDQLKDVKPGNDIKLQYKRNGSSQSATVHHSKAAPNIRFINPRYKVFSCAKPLFLQWFFYCVK